MPTLRLLVLALAGTALFAAASLVPAGAHAALLALAIAYAVSLAGVVLLDYLVSPRPRALSVTRELEDRLSLGAPNTVALRLRNRARVGLHLHLRDEAPDDFRLVTLSGVALGPEVRTPILSVEVPPFGEVVTTYEVMPVRSGAYTFGNLTVRYPTPLGLLLRQHTFALARTIKVYPNLRDVRRYDLALRRGQLREVGLRRTRQLGPGTEFERLRDYHPDDDYRRINWPATARRHRPITVDYGTERSQNVLLMLDIGRLMSISVGPLTRLDHAVNACLLTAYVCLRRGDNVGLLAFADRVALYLAPRGGKAQFQAMLEALYNVAAQPMESDYRVAFAYAEQRQRRRGLVVSFTEVVDADASRTLVAMLQRMAARHVAVCATLRDPVLDEMLAMQPTGLPEVYRRAVALTLLERRRATLETLHAHGVIPIDVSAERLTPEVINTYLDLKARGRL